MIDGIKALLGRRPFQPFMIRMNDGLCLPIPHPEWAAVHATAPTSVVAPLPEGGRQILSVRRIASLQGPSSAELLGFERRQQGGNGRGAGED